MGEVTDKRKTDIWSDGERDKRDGERKERASEREEIKSWPE